MCRTVSWNSSSSLVLFTLASTMEQAKTSSMAGRPLSRRTARSASGTRSRSPKLEARLEDRVDWRRVRWRSRVVSRLEDRGFKLES